MPDTATTTQPGTAPPSQPAVVESMPGGTEEREWLYSEIERLRGERSTRTRTFLVGLIVILGALVAGAANAGIWVDRTLLDTNDYVAAVADLPRQEAVASAVAQVTVDDLIDEATVTAEAQRLLPQDLQFAAAPLTAALEGAVEDVTRTVIETPEFQGLWIAANRLAHEDAVAILSGGSEGPLALQDGAVKLDLSAIVEPIKAELGDDAGALLGDVGSAGQLVLLQDDQFAEAQSLVATLDTVAWVLPLAALALIAGGLALSRDRRRTAWITGVATAAVMVLTLIAFAIARTEMLSQIDDETIHGAATAAWDVIGSGFVLQTILLLVIAGVVATAAWLTGPQERARAFRIWLASALDGRTTSGEPGWLTVNRRSVVLSVVGVGLALLLFWPNPTFTAALAIVTAVSTVVVVIYLATTQLQTTRNNDQALEVH